LLAGGYKRENLENEFWRGFLALGAGVRRRREKSVAGPKGCPGRGKDEWLDWLFTQSHSILDGQEESRNAPMCSRGNDYGRGRGDFITEHLLSPPRASKEQSWGPTRNDLLRQVQVIRRGN